MRIYHTADLHDRRGIAAPLRRLRAKDPGLLFDSGDSLRGSQTVYHRSEPIIAQIDAAGYDAQAVGNREFHYLYACMRARASRMGHPLICSNLIDLRRRPLPFNRAHVFAIDGSRLHVLALLVVQYPTGSPWERVFGWRFLDPIDVVREYLQTVADGEALIVLSHLGLRRDRDLAAAVPRIDAIFGGHSHDTLPEPEVAGGVPIIHAGPYGRFVSRTEFAAQQGRWRLQDSRLLPLLTA